MDQEVTKDKIAVWTEEKVGLPNYSNITVGASLSRVIDPGLTSEEVSAKLVEASTIVEDFLTAERERVLDSLK
jgi:hypothetical protein